MGKSECRGQGGELAVGHRVPYQPSGERQGVDPFVDQPVPARGLEGAIEERDVEAQVVAHEHGGPDELQKRWEHLGHRWCVGDHRIVDAGEAGDHRRDPSIGTDEGAVGAEHLAAPVAGRGHLGERRCRRGGTGGLHIHDHEGHLFEGSVRVVEGKLIVGNHLDTVANIRSGRGDIVGAGGGYRVFGDRRISDRSIRHRADSGRRAWVGRGRPLGWESQRPLPMRGLRQPHPFQCGDRSPYPGLPSLFGRR
jgi:hypothetical protein